MKKSSRLLFFLLAALIPLAGCGVAAGAYADDLMAGVSAATAGQTDAEGPTLAFCDAAGRFGFDLFARFANEENPLISPLSILLALGMAANGADGQTLAELETVLYDGLSLADINENAAALLQSLPITKKARLLPANALWVNQAFSLLPGFLQANADFYNADAIRSDFARPQTLKEINRFVEEKTDGMIPSILCELDPAAAMVLVNALSFDAEWENIYKKNDLRPELFHDLDGPVRTALLMHSEEQVFLQDELATGFIKPYANGYSFVALLPREDLPLADYITMLDQARFTALLRNASSEPVLASIPRFDLAFSASLKEALIDMGLPSSFANADFSRAGEGLVISDVFHMAAISLHEKGTRAGAATAVLVFGSSPDYKQVYLNRPFVYAIIENETALPVFIGAVTKLLKAN